MESRLVANVFDWQGRWHVTVDRVGPSAGRRYAPRRRLLAESWTVGPEMDEWAAVGLLIKQLEGVRAKLL